MNNQNDFQQRLARLEKTKRVTIPRVGGGVDPALAMQSQRKKKGLFSFGTIFKALLICFVIISMVRVGGARYAGMDFPSRKAALEIENNTSGPEYLMLRVAMIADPIWVPLLDLNNPSNTARTVAINTATQPPVAVDKTETLELINADGATVNVQEPIPTEKTLIKRIVTMLEPEHPNKPELYYPSPADSWTRITAGNMLFSADGYYSAKAAWQGTPDSPDLDWFQIPYMADFLAAQSDIKLSVNERGYAIYYDTTGKAIFVKVSFFTQLALEFGDVKDIRKPNKPSNAYLFEENNVPFHGVVTKLPQAASSAADDAQPLPTRFKSHYAGWVSPTVQVDFYTNAPKEDVVALINQFDMTTLQGLDIP